MELDFQNEVFMLALDFVNTTNKNLFLTGRAGTGKTTFLKYLKENTHKNLVVCAPTGVAAINAGGVTLHSLFQLPLGPITRPKYKLLDNLRIKSDNLEVLQQINLLIIDEVSMVRADVLDAIDYLLRKIRNNQDAFGGVQTLLIGDLYQLAPIANDDDFQELKIDYSGKYITSSRIFRTMKITYIELDRIYRQKDSAFIELLNSVRIGNCTPDQLAYINSRVLAGNFKEFDHINITTHNFKADLINKRGMGNIDSDEIKLVATIHGEFDPASFPVDETIAVKIGARIMLVRNDKEKRFYNGKIGVLKNILEDKLIIDIGDSNFIEVRREIWTNCNFKNEQNGNFIEQNVVGTFEQFPIRLAWAITVHKSQGLTFETGVIDVAEAFEPGQVYVALSRIKSISGLFLKSPIEHSAIKVDASAEINFGLGQQPTDLKSQLELASFEYLSNLLYRTFDFNCIKQITDNKNEFPKPLLLIVESKVEYVHNVNLKFLTEMAKYFINIKSPDFGSISHRVNAACNFFIPYLDDILNESRLFLKNNKDNIDYRRFIGVTRQFISKSQYLMSTIELINKVFKSIDETKNIAASLSLLNRKFKSKENREVTITQDNLQHERISLQMFKSGKSVHQVSELRKLTVQTVENHLTCFIKTGEVLIQDLIDYDLLKEVLPVLTNFNPGSSIFSMKQAFPKLSFGQIKALQAYLELN